MSVHTTASPPAPPLTTASAGDLPDLVRTHADFVYGVALRQVGDPHLAEDVTQAVFVILQRTHHALVDRPTLRGWLHTTTRYCAANALKLARRRRYHERRAARNTPVHVHDTSPSANESPAAAVGPAIDDALASLSTTDRSAVLLRFYDDLPLGDVGARLGTTEEAARKRVTRAVDKLRRFLTARGVTLSAAGVATALAPAATPAAPVALVATLTTTAALATTATLSPLTLAIAKGAIHMMTWAKVKAAAVLVTLAVTTVGGTVAVHQLLAQSTTAPAAGGAYVATLRDGLTVELLGVAANPSTDTPWWSGDGAPRPNRPYDRLGATAFAQPNERAYEFAARIANRPADGVDYRWNVQGRGGGAGSTPEGDPQAVRDVVAVAKALPASSTATLVRLDVAAGPWTTRATTDNSGSASLTATDERQQSHEIIVAPPQNTPDGAVVTIAETFVAHASRVIAVDTDGRTHVGSGHVGSAGRLRQSNSRFAGLPLDRVARFEFQTRPYDQYAEFHNVSLRPGERTEVKIVTNANDAAGVAPPNALLSVTVPDLQAPGEFTTVDERVDDQGRIRLLHAGWVDARAAATTEALEARINDAYRDGNILRDARSRVRVTETPAQASVRAGGARPGDRLSIRIWDLQAPSRETAVTEDVTANGTIRVPLLDQPINVTDLSDGQIEEAIARAYEEANILRNPPVAAVRVPPAPQAPAPPPPAAPATPRATLEGGTSVEFLGLRRVRPDPTGWWRPDGGAVAADLTRDLAWPAMDDRLGMATYEAAVQWRDLNVGGPAGGVAWGFYVGRVGETSMPLTPMPLPPRGPSYLRFVRPAQETTVDLYLNVPRGEWETVLQADLDGKPVPGTRRVEGYSLGHLGSDRTSDVLCAILGPEGRGRYSYLLAVELLDVDGQRHAAPTSAQTESTSGHGLHTVRLPEGLTREQVRQIHARARPAAWVEFAGVSLDPDRRSSAKICVGEGR